MFRECGCGKNNPTSNQSLSQAIHMDEPRNVRLSRALCYLLRHHEQSKRRKGSHWVPYLPGGWYQITDVLDSHHMQGCTLDELTDLMTESISALYHQPRFEMDTIDEELYVRARYGWSFDSAHPFGVDELNTTEEDRSQETVIEAIPTLSMLCIDVIVKNVKSYAGLTALADSYTLEQVFDRLKQQNKLNNTVLRIFCTENTEALDLSGLAVTESTLTKVAKSCPNLIELNVTGCLSVTDHMLIMMAKKCQHLRMLNISRCPNVSKEGLRRLAEHLPNLRTLVATKTPAADEEFRESLTEMFQNLTRLTI